MVEVDYDIFLAVSDDDEEAALLLLHAIADERRYARIYRFLGHFVGLLTLNAISKQQDEFATGDSSQVSCLNFKSRPDACG